MSVGVDRATIPNQTKPHKTYEALWENLLLTVC